MATKTYDGSSTLEISFTADPAGNLLQVSNIDGWSEYRDGDDLIIFSSDKTNYLKVIGAYADATRLDFIEYFFDGKSSGELRSVSTIAASPTSGLHFIAGTFENDTINGVSANSLSATGYLGDDQITGSDGPDYLGGNEGNDTIVSGTGNDVLLGGSGNDTLDGGDDDDYIDGGAGDDTLDGGAGDDEIYGGAGNDTLVQSGSGKQIFDGGAGVDTLYNNTDKYNNGLDADPQSWTAAINLSTGFLGVLEAPDHPTNDTVLNIENVHIKGRWNWEITGDEKSNVLQSGSGDDIITGGAGADTLDGGAGNNALFGGDGNDTYVYRFENGATTITDTGENTLHAISRASDGTRLYGEMYFDDEGRLVIEGNELTAPNSKLVASGITDLYWTADDNSYSPISTTIYNSNLHDLQDDLSFTFIGTHGSNTITTNTTEKYTDVYTGDGDDIITIAGSGESWIASGGGDDEVHGGGGFDIVFGDGVNNWQNMDNAGDDYLNGYEGDDELHGGGGNDTLHGGTGNDRLKGDAGYNSINGDAGNDTIILDGNGTFSSAFTALNISSSIQTGTEERIKLAGKTRFEDVMDGGADVDTVILTDASDAFFLHDSFSGFHSSLTLSNDYNDKSGTARVENIENINAGDGDDIVDLTSPDYSLTGQTITLDGGGGDDTLWGSDANETLKGGNGDDELFGGAGVNELIGGAGADEFQFSKTSTNDTVADFNISDGDTLKFFNTGGAQFDRESIALNSEGDELTIAYGSSVDDILTITLTNAGLVLDDLTSDVLLIL